MNKGWLNRCLALVLVGFMGAATTGCFGKFQLTRKLYAFNESVGEKFVQSLVCWAFVIIPVYGVAAVLDFILFNVLEFWTGSNPLAGDTQRLIHQDGDRQLAMTLKWEGGTLVATIEELRDGQRRSVLQLRDNGDGTVRSVYEEAGQPEMRASAQLLPDGAVERTVTSSGNIPVQERLSIAEVEAMSQHISERSGGAGSRSLAVASLR